MSAAANRAIDVAYGVLVAATLASFAIVDTGGVSRLAFAIIMIIAALKAGLILRNFMEIRETVLPIRLFFAAWICGVTALVVALHIFGQ